MEFNHFEDNFNYSEFRSQFNKFKFNFRLKKFLNLTLFTIGPILAILLFGLALLSSYNPEMILIGVGLIVIYGSKTVCLIWKEPGKYKEEFNMSKKQFMKDFVRLKYINQLESEVQTENLNNFIEKLNNNY